MLLKKEDISYNFWIRSLQGYKFKNNPFNSQKALKLPSIKLSGLPGPMLSGKWEAGIPGREALSH